MKWLLDTHFILWAASEPTRLPRAVADIIDDASQVIHCSAASLWEIAIKSSLPRSGLSLDPRLLRTRFLQTGYRELAVSPEHALAILGLPHHHKDPFDRMLVAQANVEGITLLTADAMVARYPGPIRYFAR